jgi:hypothetical protein
MYPSITSHKFSNFFVFYLAFATKKVPERNLITKVTEKKTFRGQHVFRERRVERALFTTTSLKFYAFFWVIPLRLKFIRRRFETLFVLSL